MVVVAPIGTKPLLGGRTSSVPAETRSGFLMLLISTKAGALRLNFCAMANNDSPGCTTYLRSSPAATVVVVATTVVEFCGLESLGPDEPPSVSNPEMMARKTNTPVLHNKYMWSRVRRNIPVMLGRCGMCQTGAPLVRLMLC